MHGRSLIKTLFIPALYRESQVSSGECNYFRAGSGSVVIYNKSAHRSIAQRTQHVAPHPIPIGARDA